MRAPHLQFGVHLCDFFDPRERQRLVLEIVRVVLCDVHRMLPEPVGTPLNWLRESLPSPDQGGAAPRNERGRRKN